MLMDCERLDALYAEVERQLGKGSGYVRFHFETLFELIAAARERDALPAMIDAKFTEAGEVYKLKAENAKLRKLLNTCGWALEGHPNMTPAFVQQLLADMRAALKTEDE